VQQDLTRSRAAADAFYFLPTGTSELVGYGCDVWIANTATGETRNLTHGAGTNWNPAWSPRGDAIAFYSDRSGEARVWIWEVATGRLRQAAAAAIRVFAVHEHPVWSGDGRYLLSRLVPGGTSVTRANAAMFRRPVRSAEGSSLLLYEAGPGIGEDGPTAPGRNPVLTERMRVDIGRIDVRTGAVQRLVRDAVIGEWWPSADGTRIAYSATDHIPTHGPAAYAISVVSIGGSTRTILAGVPESTYAGGMAWHPDGRRLTYVERAESGSVLHVVNPDRDGNDPAVTLPKGAVAGGAPLWTAPTDVWVYSVRDLVHIDMRTLQAERVPLPDRIQSVTADGTALYVVTRDADYRDAVVRVDPSGRTAIVREPEPCRLDEPRLSAGGIAVFVKQSAALAPAIYGSRDGLRTIRKLTTSPFDRMALGSTRLLRYRGADGRDMRAALLLPSGYTAGKRYPLLAWVYGGALMSGQANQFGLEGDGVFNMHFFSTRGYAVLAPDIPVGGRTRMRDIFTGVMAGVDAAIAEGVADPDRLAVFGNSNGGYSVLSLLVQTSRFKAAVMSAGFGDTFAIYGTMRRDGELYNSYYAEAQGAGDPWRDRDVYLANSPWLSLDRVTTPLLVLHGDADHTIPVAQADAVVVGLTRLGKTVSYARFVNEGHAPHRWSWPNQVEYVRRILAWCDAPVR
jgi:dipeptidyl aminopeptidase/acylaminoacyl peptidase